MSFMSIALQVGYYVILSVIFDSIRYFIFPRIFNTVPRWFKWVDLLLFLIIYGIGCFFIAVNFPSSYVN